MKKIFAILFVFLIVILTGCSKEVKEKKLEEPILILYFSETNNTEKIAEAIKEIKGYDILKIEPEKEYSKKDLDYKNEKSRSYVEQHEASVRPAIKNKLNLEKYKTIFLGYPIWFGKEPKIIISLLDNYNLEGKTIIPFCTSASSEISVSVENIRNYNPKLKVLDGKRFDIETSTEEIKNWLNSLEK